MTCHALSPDKTHLGSELSMLLYLPIPLRILNLNENKLCYLAGVHVVTQDLTNSVGPRHWKFDLFVNMGVLRCNKRQNMLCSPQTDDHKEKAQA